MVPRRISDYQAASDLDPAISTALLHWGLALADTKFWMGRRLSEWVNGAPALEAAVGAAAMTQDELGHARSMYAIMRDLPGAPPELGSETDLARVDYFNPRPLGTPWNSWTDAIAFNVLLDRALSFVIQATRESRFIPLRGRAAKMLQEEHFHRIFGDSWLARLANLGEKAHHHMQMALDRVWPVAYAWFGPANDPVTVPLVEAGILAGTTTVLREGWMAQVLPLLHKYDFVVSPLTVEWSAWEPRCREVSDG